MTDHRNSHTGRLFALIAAACLFLTTAAFATDGYFLQGFGAANSALGGAAAAGNDQDLIGSIYKNPANGLIFADRTASMAFGDVMPDVETDSSVASLHMSGTSKGTINDVPYLSLMTSWKSSNPNMAWFAGAVSEAGLSFHAAQSLTNPIFFQQPGSTGNPYGGLFGGFGDVRSSLYVIRVPIGLAVNTAGNWTWGFALAPSIGRNLFTPAAFAAPSLGLNYAPVYATVPSQDVQLGIGAQVGLRCQVDKDLSVGLSLSTPTWFHTYSWTVQTPTGGSRTVQFQMDRPLTAQIGANYALSDMTHWITDLGFIQYGSTRGFDMSGFRADGSMAGLGWQNSWTFETGIQQTVTKDLVLRAGYNYCANPIPASQTFYNVGSPLSIQNHVSVGLSYAFHPGMTLDVSYTHAFTHSESSSWYTTSGPIAGTWVTSKIGGEECAVGLTFRY